MDVVGLLRPEPAAAIGLILELVVVFGDLVTLGDAAGALDDNVAGVYIFEVIPFAFFGGAFGVLVESLIPPLDEFRDVDATITECFTAPKTFLATAAG